MKTKESTKRQRKYETKDVETHIAHRKEGENDNEERENEECINGTMC